MQCLAFQVWLISCSTASSGLICAVTCWTMSFLFHDWVLFHCTKVLQLLYLFICRWTFRSFPHPGYCEQCCSEHWSTHITLRSWFRFIWKLHGLWVSEFMELYYKRRRWKQIKYVRSLFVNLFEIVVGKSKCQTLRIGKHTCGSCRDGPFPSSGCQRDSLPSSGQYRKWKSSFPSESVFSF